MASSFPRVARLSVTGVMRAHGGLEYLGVVGGELVGGFPGEVGDLAPGGQALQRRVVRSCR